MIGTIVSILVTLGILALIVWLIETYFPALPILWKAVLIAGLILAAIRTLHNWVCGWLCG